MTFESVTTNRADDLVQKTLPKFLVGILLLTLLYLIKFFSDKIAFIFDSNISIRNFTSLSFNYYFLCVVTLVFFSMWVFILTRSILLFFQTKFDTPVNSPKLKLLFNLNVLIFSVSTYVVMDYFMPQAFLMLGPFTLLEQIISLLSLHMTFLPALISYTDYMLVTSTALLVSVSIIAISTFVFFVYHFTYYLHKILGYSDYLSSNYTIEVGSAFFYFFSIFVLAYLLLWYNLITDVLIKIGLLLVVLTLLLWVVYKTTSAFYFNMSNSWVYSENSILIYFMLIIIFFIFPVLFWFIHDMIFIYFDHTVKYTVLVDFKQVLVNSNIVSNSVYAKPGQMNFVILLLLTMVSIHRILLVDVFLVGFFCLAVVIYMQLNYIITYFKSSFNTSFREQLQEENAKVYAFNQKIKSKIILKLLFIVFIAFLSWDVVAVIYSNFIRPLKTSFFPDISHNIVITQLVNLLNTLQYPFNYFGILLLLLLFIAVLIVLNIVAIKLHEKLLEHSFTGVYSIFTISFVVILSYLIYDLQNYQFNPVAHFQLLMITNTLYYTSNMFLLISVFCDTAFLLFAVAIFVNRVKKHFKAKDHGQPPTDEKAEEESIATEVPEAEEGEVLTPREVDWE